MNNTPNIEADDDEKVELTGSFQALVENALFTTPIGKHLIFTFQPSGRMAKLKLIEVKDVSITEEKRK